MDFYAMKRKELQSLCKEHGIPANLKNTQMAERLTLLFKENEIENDSEVETKRVKKVKFSPDNQTFYFVGTDDDSNSDGDYNPKRKWGRRKSLAVKQVLEKNKREVQVSENARGIELSVEIFGSAGRVKRSRAQDMVKGGAEAVFSPLPGRKKVRACVKKGGVCDKLPQGVESTERVDGNVEHGKVSVGLIQRQLRSGAVLNLRNVEGAGESVEPHQKNIRRSKRNLARDRDCGELTETKVTGRNKKPKTEVVGKASVHEECNKVPQLEGPSYGQNMKTSRRKAPVVRKGKELENGDTKERPMSMDLGKASKDKQSVEREEQLPNGPLRRSRRKTIFLSSGVPDDRELIIHEAAGTLKQSKASGQEECKEVSQHKEPSKGPSMNTSRRKLPVLQKGKEKARGDARKRPRHTDSDRASNVEQSVETTEESALLLPNVPLRRSRRKATLFSSDAADDRELRIHKAAGTVKQSTESVSEKGFYVTKPLNRPSHNACKSRATEATDDMGEISNGVKKDEIVKQIQEPALEKESLHLVNDSLNKRPQSQSSHDASKSEVDAPTGKDKKSESRMPIIEDKVLFSEANSPLEERPYTDVGVDYLEAAGNENDTVSCSNKKVVEKSSKKRKGLSKKRESAVKGQPVTSEVSTVYSDLEKRMDISARTNENQLSESKKFEGVSKLQMAQDGTEPLINMIDSFAVEDGILDNATVGNTDDHSSPSFNSGDTDNDKAVEQNPVECSAKLSNVVSSRFTYLGDQSPTYQPACEGECSNHLDLKGVETDGDQNFAQLDASAIYQPVLVEPAIEKHLTELVENKVSDRNTEKFSEVVEEIGVLSPFKRKEIVQVDHSRPYLNRGDTGQAITGEQSPVQYPQNLSNVVSCRLTCLGDGHSPSFQPDCEGECSNLLDLKKELETDESLTAMTTTQRSYVVDDQLADGSKACVPEDQNVVQMDASEIDQPFLVERVTEDHLTELVETENKVSVRNTEMSAEVVEKTIALSPCDQKEVGQVDHSCLSLNRRDTDHKTVEQNPVECSDKLSNVVSSRLGDAHSPPYQPASESECSNLLDLKEGLGKESLNAKITNQRSNVVDDQSADDQNLVQLDSSRIHQPVLVEPVTENHPTELVENKMPDRNSEKSSEVIEEISALSPRDRKEMVQVDVGSIKTAETSPETVGEIHQDGNVPIDTAVTPSKSSLVKQGDLCVLNECNEDDKKNSEEKEMTYEDEGNDPSAPIQEDGVATEHTAVDRVYLDAENVDKKESSTEIAGGLSDVQKGNRAFELHVKSEVFAMLTEATRIGDSGYTSVDKHKNSEVARNKACAMTGVRREMQQPGDRGSLLPFDSAGSEMGFPQHRAEFYKINVPVVDEVKFGGLGPWKETSSELDKCAYASPGDSISTDDETAERVANARKMDDESSSKDISFDAQKECDLDAIPVLISNKTSDHLAENECTSRNYNNVGDAVLVYGHKNNKVGTRSMEAIIGFDNVGVAAKLIVASQLTSDGGNLSEEKNCSDDNSFFDISSSRADFGPSDLTLSMHNVSLPCDDPERRDLPTQGDKFGMAERVSGMKDNEDLNATTDGLCSVLGGDLNERTLPAEEGGEFRVAERVSAVKVVEGLNAGIDGFGEENYMRASQETEEELDIHQFNVMEISPGGTKEFTENKALESSGAFPIFDSSDVKELINDEERVGVRKSDPEMAKVNSVIDDIQNMKKGKESAVVIPQVAAGQHFHHDDKLEQVVELKSTQEIGIHEHKLEQVLELKSTQDIGIHKHKLEQVVELKSTREIGIRCNVGSPVADFASCEKSIDVSEMSGRNSGESEIFTYWEMNTIFGDAVQNIAEKSDEPLQGHLINKHTESAMDGAYSTKIIEHSSQQFSGNQLRYHEDNAELAEGTTLEDDERCNDQYNASAMIQEYIDCEKGGDLEVRDLPAEEGNQFRVPERVSGVKVGEGINAVIDGLGEENCTKTFQETEEELDLPNFNDMEISSADRKESTENKALESNGASAIFNSFEMKELFSNDVIDGDRKSGAEMSKVNSVIDDSEVVKKGKDGAVVTSLVGAGQRTDYEHKLEDVVELKSTEEMGLNFHVGSPGDGKGDEFQKLGAWIVKVNEVSEDVTKGIENTEAVRIRPDFAEQHRDHGKRMAEVLKSTHLPVSNENTNEGPKEEGIRPVDQEFVNSEDIDESGAIEYSNACRSTEKLIDNAEMSGKNSGAFDVPIANSAANYLNKVPVESDTVAELKVTVDQSPTSANSTLRKENLEPPRKMSWVADSDKGTSLSCLPRLENKKDSLIPRTPKSLFSTFDMKENFRSTKSNQVPHSAVKVLQPRRALEDLQKK